MLKDLDSIFMVGILAKDVPVASGVWYWSGLKRARKDPTDKGTFDVCYVKLNVSTVRADVGQMEMFDLSAGAR